MADTDYITIAEAASRAKIHPRTICRWINEGKIPAWGTGRVTRVRMADVMRPRKPPRAWAIKKRSRKMCADHKEVAPRPADPISPEAATAAPEQGKIGPISE